MSLRRLRLLGICAIRRTGDRLAILDSTARLIPSQRSGSRGVRLLRSVTSRRLRTPRTGLNLSRDRRCEIFWTKVP